MERINAGRASVVAGALALALTIGALALRAARTAPEDLRDAVAAPLVPAALGGARVAAPDPSWFASPAGRRAEAERALSASRSSSSSTRARVARLRREAARERALAVSAQ